MRPGRRRAGLTVVGEQVPRVIGPWRLEPWGNAIRVRGPFRMHRPISYVPGAQWRPDHHAWVVPACHAELLVAELSAANDAMLAVIRDEPLPPPRGPRQLCLELPEPDDDD